VQHTAHRAGTASALQRTKSAQLPSRAFQLWWGRRLGRLRQAWTRQGTRLMLERLHYTQQQKQHMTQLKRWSTCAHRHHSMGLPAAAQGQVDKLQAAVGSAAGTAADTAGSVIGRVQQAVGETLEGAQQRLADAARSAGLPAGHPAADAARSSVQQVAGAVAGAVGDMVASAQAVAQQASLELQRSTESAEAAGGRNAAERSGKKVVEPVKPWRWQGGRGCCAGRQACSCSGLGGGR